MPPRNDSQLTSGEVTLAQSFFGTLLGVGIDYGNVKIKNQKGLPGQDDATVMTLPHLLPPWDDGTTIYYPPGHGWYSDDFSLEPDDAAGWARKHNFIHEMWHVKQNQEMLDATYGDVVGGDAAKGDYNYNDVFYGTNFEDLNTEQQAEFLADYFLLVNGKGDLIDRNKKGGTVEERPIEDYEDALDGVDLDGLYDGYDASATERTNNAARGGNAVKPEGDDADAEDRDSSVDDVRVRFEAGKSNGSPLVLDIDGDGIELTSLNSSNAVYWDIDLDGFAEASGWITGGDGLLAIDLNNDGIINNSSELFGDQTGYSNGFYALRAYDTNFDDRITSEDAAWNDFVVWIDDGDGYSGPSELHSLGSLLITEISVEYADVNYALSGNTIYQEGGFTINGNTRDIVDAYFAYSNVNTLSDETYTFDFRTWYLPNLRGTGNLSSFKIALSIDNDDQDPDSLMSLMLGFVALEVDEIFVPNLSVVDMVTEIMYRWAGVENVAVNSRGSSLQDARVLEFLEEMMGEEYRQTGSQGQSNPFWNAAADLEEAFWTAQQYVYARLVAQSAGGALFEGDWYYDPASDNIVGVTGLDASVVDDLEILATGLANTGEREVFWANVVRMIEFTIGIDGLSGGDESYLDAAITASDSSLDLSDIEALLVYDAPTGSPHSGTGGDDVLSTGSGNDDIDAGSGNDTINAGTDNDYVKGGPGNDTYIYAVGDGDDVYKEQSTGSGNDADRILFGTGIDIGDLTLSRVGSDGLLIEIDTGTYEAIIALENHFNYAAGGGHIEWLEFSDTSTFDLDGQSWTTYGTAGADDIRGVRDGYGGLGNDTIYGLGGNDWIRVNAPNESDYLANTVYGGDGDDSIHGDGGADTLYGDAGNDYIEGGSGNDTLSGGAGDDKLIGELGNDTFIYSAGHDYINDNSGTDAINLDAAWNGVTPLYLRTNNTLTVWFDANNTITINNHYSGNAVESMVYANSTTVNLTTVSAVSQGDDSGNTLNGTTGVDTIYGNGGNDTIDAKGGNDTVYGGSGDDYIEGGNGNDYLDGGPGSDSIEGGGDNDTYYYSSGHDWFNDTSGTDTLVFANGWTIEQMTFNRYVADIDDMVIEINGSNSVTIEGQFGNSKKLETFTWQAGSVSSATIVVTAHGTSGNDTISGFTYGGSTNDIVYGYDGADTLTGGDGNDTLYGGNGNDTLVGSNDNDVLYGGAGDDYMGGASSGNAGNDTFVYESGLDTVTDYLGSSSSDTLWISGGRTINDIASFANSGSNDTLLTITASVDEILVKYLRGGSQHHVEWVTFDDGFTTSLPDYASWINGTSGNDVAAGNGSDNTIVGFAGNDTITGAGGNDEAHGGAGDDSLDGGDGTDLLYGGDDDDILYGKAGLDTMHGGDGADTFVFETASAFSDIDVIRDFSVTDADVLDLTDILDTVYDPMTDAIADFVEFTESSGSTFVSVDRDGTGGTYSMAQIIKLENVTGLASPDTLETNGNLLAA